MDSAVLQDLAQTVKGMGNLFTVYQTMQNKKVFDGSNADAFAKWLLDMNDIYEAVNHDDQKNSLGSISTTERVRAKLFERQPRHTNDLGSASRRTQTQV